MSSCPRMRLGSPEPVSGIHVERLHGDDLRQLRSEEYHGFGDYRGRRNRFKRGLRRARLVSAGVVGVVDEHVDLAELAERLVDERATRLRLGDVGCNRERTATRAADLRGEVAQLLLVARSENDGCAFARERETDGLAE